eukprot:SAG31_NODE_12767_length_918_cov_1.253968_2_plen_118_part_01
MKIKACFIPIGVLRAVLIFDWLPDSMLCTRPWGTAADLFESDVRQQLGKAVRGSANNRRRMHVSDICWSAAGHPPHAEARRTSRSMEFCFDPYGELHHYIGLGNLSGLHGGRGVNKVD